MTYIGRPHFQEELDRRDIYYNRCTSIQNLKFSERQRNSFDVRGIIS